MLASNHLCKIICRDGRISGFVTLESKLLVILGGGFLSCNQLARGNSSSPQQLSASFMTESEALDLLIPIQCFSSRLSLDH